MNNAGGSIGAGFFVGSGGALAKGGPGSLLLDFAIIGIMMFNVGTSQPSHYFPSQRILVV